MHTNLITNKCYVSASTIMIPLHFQQMGTSTSRQGTIVNKVHICDLVTWHNCDLHYTTFHIFQEQIDYTESLIIFLFYKMASSDDDMDDDSAQVSIIPIKCPYVYLPYYNNS